MASIWAAGICIGPPAPTHPPAQPNLPPPPPAPAPPPPQHDQIQQGDPEAAAYWAVDVGEGEGGGAGDGSAYVDLRTLMVATDWSDKDAMGDLAIAGHARALLEWHNTAKFCGACGAKAVPTEAGRKKQCSNESCKKRIYPRVDPVVIMLVTDKENDRALLSRQSRFVPRMWSCLAGFIEPGESLEEAVRRETWEETGIEVGQVIYHSSQPWPVGPNTMPCQLMVGFFAYAKSLEIHVDKQELENAQWHSREDIKKALTFAEYEKAQRTSAHKVSQMCKGAEKGHSLSADLNVERAPSLARCLPPSTPSPAPPDAVDFIDGVGRECSPISSRVMALAELEMRHRVPDAFLRAPRHQHHRTLWISSTALAWNNLRYLHHAAGPRTPPPWPLGF